LRRAGHFTFYSEGERERGAIQHKIVAMDANKADATYETMSLAIAEGLEPI